MLRWLTPRVNSSHLPQMFPILCCGRLWYKYPFYKSMALSSSHCGGGHTATYTSPARAFRARVCRLIRQFVHGLPFKNLYKQPWAAIMRSCVCVVNSVVNIQKEPHNVVALRAREIDVLLQSFQIISMGYFKSFEPYLIRIYTLKKIDKWTHSDSHTA